MKTQVKWTDIYKDEEDMLNDLRQVHVPKNTFEELLVINHYRGYDYIHSFAKQLQKGKTLSEKQILQCKRLAQEIEKAYMFTLEYYPEEID